MGCIDVLGFIVGGLGVVVGAKIIVGDGGHIFLRGKCGVNASHIGESRKYDERMVWQ